LAVLSIEKTKPSFKTAFKLLKEQYIYKHIFSQLEHLYVVSHSTLAHTSKLGLNIKIGSKFIRMNYMGYF